MPLLFATTQFVITGRRILRLTDPWPFTAVITRRPDVRRISFTGSAPSGGLQLHAAHHLAAEGRQSRGRGRPALGDGPASRRYGVTVTPGAISAVPLVSFPVPVAPSELTKRSSWLVPPALPTASSSVDWLAA